MKVSQSSIEHFKQEVIAKAKKSCIDRERSFGGSFLLEKNALIKEEGFVKI